MWYSLRRIPLGVGAIIPNNGISASSLVYQTEILQATFDCYSLLEDQQLLIFYEI